MTTCRNRGDQDARRPSTAERGKGEMDLICEACMSITHAEEQLGRSVVFQSKTGYSLLLCS
eukprot:756514-Amphidinium_carterae.1